MMPGTDRIKKTLTDTRPFYAAAGASDLAMEKLRPRLAALRGDLAPKALQHRVRDRVGTLRHDVQALPEKAAETYDHLAERGRNAVGRISRPRPTEKFAEQTGKAVRGEQATRATARKRAARTTPVEGVTATEPTSPAEAGE
jgi:heparin binding hemagglutinin HbhA